MMHVVLVDTGTLNEYCNSDRNHRNTFHAESLMHHINDEGDLTFIICFNFWH